MLVMSPVPLPMADMDDTGKVWKNYPAFSPLVTFADVPLVDRRGHTTRTHTTTTSKVLSLSYVFELTVFSTLLLCCGALNSLLRRLSSPHFTNSLSFLPVMSDFFVTTHPIYDRFFFMCTYFRTSLFPLSIQSIYLFCSSHLFFFFIADFFFFFSPF